MESDPAQILDEYFDQIQQRVQAPEIAYGLSFARESVALRNNRKAFRIASMTKSFTSAALLLLRDRKLLSLDTPVHEIVPELASMQPPTTDSPAITPRHLMTMSSGLAWDDPWTDRKVDASPAEMDALLRAGGYMAVAPGVQFVYSSFGYGILGRVIDNVTGMPYSKFINAELLEPLGMSSTVWNTPNDNYALPFRVRDGKAIPDQPDPIRGDGGVGPMGGLWSTVDDILKWANFMLDAFPARNDPDNGPLKRSSRREMQQGSRVVGVVQSPFGDTTRATPITYCMGLRNTYDEVLGKLVDHPGGFPGYGSNMIWSPDRQFALVWLANVTYADRVQANLGALEALHNAGILPHPQPVSAQPLEHFAKALVSLLNDWDDRVADEIFLENVALDEPYDRRRNHVSRQGKGPFRIERLTAFNAAQGEVALKDAQNHDLTLSFSLSSHVPPLIQAYQLKPSAA